jgi:hypothetical protein
MIEKFHPLSIPLVAREIRRYSKNEIEKVTMYNVYDFYKQSDKFAWNLKIQYRIK